MFSNTRNTNYAYEINKSNTYKQINDRHECCKIEYDNFNETNFNNDKKKNF